MYPDGIGESIESAIKEAVDRERARCLLAVKSTGNEFKVGPVPAIKAEIVRKIENVE